MPQPVELDIAVGSHGDRYAVHIETLAHVDPAGFVTAVYEFACRLLAEGELGTPQASATAGEHQPVAPEAQGSGVSGDGESAPVASGTGSPEPVTTDERWERMEERRKARIAQRLTNRGVEVA